VAKIRFALTDEEKCKAEVRRECADLVLDFMKYYEDEECSGTIRTLLKCLAERIMKGTDG